MQLSWARRFMVPTGVMLGLSVIFVFLAGLPQAAKAQSAGDRWVTLATRAIDAKAGRARFDLSKARGAFRAVRVSVRTGALALTQIELKYEGAARPLGTAGRGLAPEHTPRG